jgi:peptidoglycan/xylan/chitin deacetylase (PgdA/CDA1 family)
MYLSAVAAMSRGCGDRFLRCVYCHYVFDDQRAAFERIIRSLQQIGHFVDTDTCVQMCQGTKPIDGRYFHLSFDDGFRNNFTNAVPILRDLGVHAAFYVPSAFVGADYATVREYCLESTRYRGVIEMMSWDDLQAMVEQGFEVGSHTRRHARFSMISGDAARMEDEIAGSKREIETKLGRPCKYIAWPYGRLVDADSASLEVAKRAGYAACFGAFRGTVRPGQTDLFRIPRHQFEPQWPLSHILYFARGNMEVTA